MSLVLLNLQSNQQIDLDSDTPLIIGRGNVNGCFDKRVSRSHGRITCTVDGKIRVVALHSNPCFFTRNGVPPVQQLNKNEEETLNEGDYLGLLPNAFWFKITSNVNIKNKNNPDFSDTKTNIISDEINGTILLENNIPSSNQEEITSKKEPNNEPAENIESQSSKSKSMQSYTSCLEGSGSFGTPEFEKTKRLPLHMYQIDDPLPQTSTKKHSLENITNSKGKKQKLLSEGDIKKEFEMKTPENIKVEDKICNYDVPSTSRVDEMSNMPCKSEKENEETPKDNNEKEGYESLVEGEEDLVSKRPICQYEDKCYRKNPQHKLDFCHPGDPDYIPYEERPLCQYGAACYRQNERHRSEYRHPPPGSNLSSPSHSVGSRGEERPPCLGGSTCRNQNPQHRKKLYHPPKGYNCIFKHSDDSPLDWDSESSLDDFMFWDDLTSGYFDSSGDSEDASSPLPEKRRRKTVKMQKFDNEDDDEYDTEEPFANDASSDDFIPSDLESEEEEILDA